MVIFIYLPAVGTESVHRYSKLHFHSFAWNALFNETCRYGIKTKTSLKMLKIKGASFRLLSMKVLVTICLLFKAPLFFLESSFVTCK